MISSSLTCLSKACHAGRLIVRVPRLCYSTGSEENASDPPVAEIDKKAKTRSVIHGILARKSAPDPKTASYPSDELVNLLSLDGISLDSYLSLTSKSVALSAPPLDDNAPFSQWIRRSPLVRLGEPRGRVVLGRVAHVIGNDLYVDFGCKFNCVCKRPTVDGKNYVKGSMVRVRLHDLELSSRFLGSEVDMTLLEADATLIGLHRTDSRKNAGQ